MRWAVIVVDQTHFLVVDYKDNYDYDICAYDGLYSWRMYQEGKPSKLGQELIQETLEAFQGDLTLEEDGEMLLETLKQVINRRLLTAEIKVVQ